MFTQQISMDCSEEQYNKLVPLLREIGYVTFPANVCLSEWESSIIVNNWNEKLGEFGLTFGGRVNAHERMYLGEFNAPLFLARAAMTDSRCGGIGEYWKFTGYSTEKWTDGKLYRALKPVDAEFAFIDNLGNENGWYPRNHRSFVKATVEEITNYFTNKETIVMKENTFITTRSQMGKIHGIACSGWKPKIMEYTQEYGNTFDDVVVLPRNVVEEMFAAATSEQLPVLRSIFPEFQKDKNAFISQFVASKPKEISAELFGDAHALQIATEAARDLRREDLYGKAFYVTSEFEVKLHDIHGGTIIEITKN